MRSELRDPANRNIARPNLPAVEKRALEVLINLQKTKQIVIKPCDKGAGIIILDYEEYVRACKSHLESKQTQPDGSLRSYYRTADNLEIDVAKDNIVKVLEEGLDNNIISQDEFDAMDPRDKDPAKFYAMFKVHKKHQEGKAPPERPIISCCNSITENIGEYCAHKLRSIMIHIFKTPQIFLDILTL